MATIPVDYVELTEGEEDLALAVLADLLRQVEADEPALQDLREVFF